MPCPCAVSFLNFLKGKFVKRENINWYGREESIF